MYSTVTDQRQERKEKKTQPHWDKGIEIQGFIFKGFWVITASTGRATLLVQTHF